jgi:hypothetical protein
LPDQNHAACARPAVELRGFRFFRAVVEELHFGRAADRMHTTQPPLSRAIRRFEQEFGVRLLGSRSKTVNHRLMCRRDPDVDNGQVPVEVMDESRSVTRTTHDAEPRAVQKARKSLAQPEVLVGHHHANRCGGTPHGGGIPREPIG